ncbi:hypothetical protein [Bradyrhizobium cenepequi]
MVAVKVSAFGGMVPATEPRLLPDQAAALSQDTWLYSGDLVGFVEPTFVRDMLESTSGKAYRIPNNYFDAEHFDDATWMEFPSIDTDVIRSPIVGDTFDRYYWASPLDQPRVNSLARIKNGDPPFALGVPQANSPTLAITGGASATTESRAYATTYVTTFKEEGPPSAPVLGTGKVDATWTTSFAAPSAADIAKYNLEKVRVYRTVTAVGGSATFFFVAELAVTATTYADTITSTVVSSNNQLESTTWTGPPDDLLGWVSLPNGMIAGWRGSEIWFCEPFRPHAWPVQYALSVEYPIVGLGVINQTLVVLTAGYPMVATGINPASMSLSKLASLEPCLSRGSILSTPEGVYYGSPNGLMLVANGSATNISLGLIMKDEWNRLAKVATLRAARLVNAYFAFGSARPGFFQTDPEAWQANWLQPEDFAGARNGVVLDPTNQRVAFNVVSSDDPITNVFSDAWSGEVIIIRNGKVYRVNINDETSPRRAFKWRSKLFQATDKKNFQAIKVYFDIPPWAPVQSPVRNTDNIQTLGPDQYGLVRVYADKQLVMTRELRTSGELMRLPAGFKADYWQIEFEAVVVVTSVQMATSVKELMKA